MSDFEGSLKRAIEERLKERDTGVTYRRKQARYTSQVLDVIIDNPFIGIECKSIKASSRDKLYFSQHFSEDQVDRTTEFLDRSGRKGYLALEIRRGRGKPKEAYLIYWNWVYLRKSTGAKGLVLAAIQDKAEHTETILKIPREGGDYKISDKILKDFESTEGIERFK